MQKLTVTNRNSKVNALLFDLPCRTTCKPGLKCHKYCYAKKAERIYPAVLPCRTRNLDNSEDPTFMYEMVDILKRKKQRIIRLHSSGDFYSRHYILKWYAVMEAMPDKKFYAYTKRDDLFDARLLAEKPSNFTLIFSVDGIQSSSRGMVYADKGYNKVAITHSTLNNCPAIDDKNCKCMIDCRKCISRKRELIIFRKH